MKSKKANILTENVIFIILNIVFFSIMLLFIYLQSSNVHLDEQEIAKKIALLIDASKSGTEIQINLEEFFDKAGEEGISEARAVVINNEKNLVIVKGSEDSFYEYSFFNDVQVSYDVKENFLILVIAK